MALHPSETTRGSAWLENFTPADEPAARVLLNSLQIATLGDVLIGIKTEIAALGDQLLDSAPGSTAMLLPVVSAEDIYRSIAAVERHRKEVDEVDETGDTHSQDDEGRHQRHVAWESYAPGVPISATPGSEGPVGNAIRDLTGETPGREPSCWLHPETELDALADKRCRMIVLVTDYSGSGKQVVEMARTLTRNPRVRSWRSFGWTKIVVVAYAMSLEARKAIDASGSIDTLHVAVPGASFADAPWTPEERESIERICVSYATRRKRAFGFGNSAGLFLSHSSIPNNLPNIFLRTGGNWNALFDGKNGRIFPADMATELGTYGPLERDLAKVAEETGQERLARAIASGRLRTPADRLVATLALLARGPVDATTLSHRFAVPERTVSDMLRFLREVGFLDQDLTLTAAGRAELRHSRRLDRIVTAHLAGSDDNYYPQSLR